MEDTYKRIDGKRVLVIPDVHQHVEWAKEILRLENEKVDFVVWLDDFFDTHEKDRATIQETAEFWKKYVNLDRHTMLWSNHSISYREDFPCASKRRKNHNPMERCSGFSRNKSEKIGRILSFEDWQKTEPFVLVNDWLISHAGVSRHFWNYSGSVESNLTNLYKECEIAIALLGRSHSRLFHSSSERGGEDKISGLIWLDFQEEFKDELPLRQLVGHTPIFGEECTVMKLGRSYDLDGSQSTYGVIEPTGELTLKAIIRNKAGVWEKREVTVLSIDDWVAGRTNERMGHV